MHEINIKNFDLNLLRTFYFLLEEQNVTRAAARAGLSQSAMSHALSRLRTAFDDPLFVRGPGGMEPTARAQALKGPVRRLLQDMIQLIDDDATAPVQFRGTTRIVAADYAMAILLPRVLSRLEAQAPQIDVECQHWSDSTMAQLDSGLVDLVLGGQRPFAGFIAEELFSEKFITVCRSDHPYPDTAGTPEDYVRWPHAHIHVPNSRMDAIDTELARQGLERRIRLRLPHFLAAPMIVANSDMLLTMPERIAALMAPLADLASVDLPFDLGTFSYIQIWHRRRHDDPMHRWIREIIRDEADALENGDQTSA